ncbi:hypothetical protein INT46_009973 [Mucor plumbeus]|uniref:Uncharacterized protein n=1 Tax=Mucor plumbeus TaxID=97098 RepID=A0A8H7R3V7_9FUNG|nr:hypothetical protein INT46_009973 [Mucor plumbeus]
MAAKKQIKKQQVVEKKQKRKRFKI